MSWLLRERSEREAADALEVRTIAREQDRLARLTRPSPGIDGGYLFNRGFVELVRTTPEIVMEMAPRLFQLRTDNVSTALGAVKAGVGLGLLPDALAEGLVKVELGASPPIRGVWISMHPTSARQPRVRTVVRWLAETFQSLGKRRR